MILDTLGLTDAEESELIEQMTTSHDYTLHVELRNRAEDPIDEISEYVVSGQVDLDLTTPDDPTSVGRKMTLRLFDPDRDINLSQRNLLNRAIALDQQVFLPSRGERVAIPLGVMDIIRADPEGPWLNLTCLDKRNRCRGNLLDPHTFAKGDRVVDDVTYALHTLAGIALNNIELTSIPDTLPRDFQTHVGLSPWWIATHLASTVGHVLWVDAAGKFRWREWPTEPVFDFTPKMICGQSPSSPGWITPAQSLTDDAGRPLPNTIIVTGYRATKGQPPLTRIRYAPPSSPISKESLRVGGDDGVDFITLERANFPNARDPKRLDQIGDNRLAVAETIAVSYNWNALTLPVWDDYDRVSADDGYITCATNIRQASFPITVDSGVMSIGARRMLSFAGAKAR